ncbi:MAG: glycosyltransferase family 87 protein [Chloroflexota bacterium]
MQNKTNLSIRSFTKEGRQNIILAALAIFYLTQFSLDLFVWKIMCTTLAQDYCGYWSTAKIANENGYAEIYNLDKLADIQRSTIHADVYLGVHGFPYLPIFILPFQFLYFLGPYIGYWVWTLISLILFISYIQYFAKETTQQTLNMRLLFMVLLSLSFFQNIFVGQVNLWLTICIGEHLRAIISGKQYTAGAWLAGLLLKPQYLIIICLVLLIQRYGKILAGFTISSTLIIGISFLMSGIDGFKAMLRIWLSIGASNSQAAASIMMNWRMVAVDLADHLGPGIAWAIAGTGIIATLILTLYIWRQPISPESSSYIIAMLGTLAATTALAWHSNIASSVILIAPLIYLSEKPVVLPENIFSTWVFVPSTASFVVIIMAVLFQSGRLPAISGDLLDFLIAAAQLGVNMILLIWVASQFRSKKFSTAQA